MTNLTALKTLYTALGGTGADVADVKRNAEMINAIATLVSASGGATLPAVDTDDNGKVLTVVAGKWTADSVTLNE